MPEAGYLPIPAKLARAGVKDMVRISDARMSGTAFGTIVLHVVAGGRRRRPARAGAQRRPHPPQRGRSGASICWSPRPSWPDAGAESRRAVPARGYARLYLDHVLQAEHGCDFDFLRHTPTRPRGGS